MENFAVFLLDNLDAIILNIASLVMAIITYRRTGKVKRSLDGLTKGDMEVMDYRTANYRATDPPLAHAQKFPNVKTEYELDRHTNELVELEEKTDLQAQINSENTSSLDMLLEKFGVSNFSDIIGGLKPTLEENYERATDDLMDIANAMDIAEEYRDKLKLPLEMNISDVFKEVDKYAHKLSDEISALDKLKNKEVTQNVEAKKAQPSEVSPSVQEHGEESTQKKPE